MRLDYAMPENNITELAGILVLNHVPNSRCLLCGCYVKRNLKQIQGSCKHSLIDITLTNRYEVTVTQPYILLSTA